MGNRGKIEEQNRARDLRAEGWTYGEIQAELGVSRSSVSLWCRDVEVDPDLLDDRRRAAYERGQLRKRPHAQHQRKLEEIEACRDTGRSVWTNLSAREHLAAGLGLYAGDGSKRDGALTFANSDPALVAFFCEWLRRHFEIDETRLRVRLYLHHGLDLDAANRFWSELTDIPLEQFGKAYRAVPDPSIRAAKHVNGCAHVRYSSKLLHRKILGQIDALLGSSFLPG